MEPAHINMKSSEPIIKFTKYINKFIKKLLDFKIINKISLLRMILSLWTIILYNRPVYQIQNWNGFC